MRKNMRNAEWVYMMGIFLDMLEWSTCYVVVCQECDSLYFFCDHRDRYYTLKGNDAMEFITGKLLGGL